MTTSTMSISLPESLKDFIRTRVIEGHYSNPSDYIRSLIREDQKRQVEERLEALLLEGLESGASEEATDEYWQTLMGEVRERIEARKQRK